MSCFAYVHSRATCGEAITVRERPSEKICASSSGLIVLAFCCLQRLKLWWAGSEALVFSGVGLVASFTEGVIMQLPLTLGYKTGCSLQSAEQTELSV